MQPPAAAISKRAILSVRMAPFGSPKKRKGRCPLTPELPYLTHISEIICGRFLLNDLACFSFRSAAAAQLVRSAEAKTVQQKSNLTSKALRSRG